MESMKAKKPLEGIRVLEFGSFIAGPFCSRLMADFGAEVIKVESPNSGDPLRNWGLAKYKGESLWWPIQARNKKCITLNLKEEEGQEIVKKLVKEVDIIVENFRPGTMEKWGLGYEDLKEVNPSIIMVRISGFGQTGPYKEKAGFGSVGEAIGGIRHITGYPDRPPTRVGVAIGDSLTAMFGVIGALMALHHRDNSPNREGQFIDAALYESVFAIMESSLTEYMKVGAIRERTGTFLPKVAPSNNYPTKEGKWIVIGANADNIFKRLTKVMNMEELAEDERFATHNARGENQEELDEIISDWTKNYGLEELTKMLDEAGVPAGGIYTAEDIANDIHYQARDMILKVMDKKLGELYIPGVVPKLSETPGEVEWTGPEIGEHNEEVYKEILQFNDEEFADLKEKGII
ncbi:CoA transferase [Ornithinibacillus sp. L9]|uniref:CoA transferase n=1 Tax=Ornithinibacillus caprae TaxID=2678566 RepID=A0A6N8FDM8_9BACI|nr:CoA transferase [Ornithinibacillus caprae]MUK87643.1 CoA transferase [Ornithinibacillus caprae]